MSWGVVGVFSMCFTCVEGLFFVRCLLLHLCYAVFNGCRLHVRGVLVCLACVYCIGFKSCPSCVVVVSRVSFVFKCGRSYVGSCVVHLAIAVRLL